MATKQLQMAPSKHFHNLPFPHSSLPEAEAQDHHHHQPSSPLTQLPQELLNSILSYLPNRAIKSLRQTCRSLCASAHLRLNRAFLSANPLNISVFRAIAYHDTFRHGIEEIVWDDSLLLSDSQGRAYHGFPDESATELLDGVPTWFRRGRGATMAEIRRRNPAHAAKLRYSATQTVAQSWQHYQQLRREQDAVLESGADVEALRLGLARFPNLRRITITPAAHGFQDVPLYETPMMRALPSGFYCPVPRGCGAMEAPERPTTPLPWDRPGISREDLDEMESMWRGFRIVTAALAATTGHQLQHRVSELVLDVACLNSGLNCHIFDQPCEEYDTLVAIISRPGFHRLDLALQVVKLELEDWISFRSGYLLHALEKAVDMEHFSLRTNVERNEDPVLANGWGVHNHVPLRTIIPVDKWPRLRHLGLSGFLVQQTDVVSLLASLPPTVRSVELSFLYFLDGSGSYRDLLVDMREKLGWSTRPETRRPKVRVGVSIAPIVGRAIWVDKEVDQFLYRDGENPFGFGSGFPNTVRMGKGIWRDRFDPAYEQPYVSWSGLMTRRWIG